MYCFLLAKLKTLVAIVLAALLIGCSVAPVKKNGGTIVGNPERPKSIEKPVDKEVSPLLLESNK